MDTWLPDSWVIEVRAGGKMMDKMYKVNFNSLSHYRLTYASYWLIVFSQNKNYKLIIAHMW
jgi:hypothetical protein